MSTSWLGCDTYVGNMSNTLRWDMMGLKVTGNVYE